MSFLEVLPQPVNVIGEFATFIEERYGSHPRNTFDIWLAESDWINI